MNISTESISTPINRNLDCFSETAVKYFNANKKRCWETFHSAIDGLFNNEIKAIKIKHFATLKECYHFDKTAKHIKTSQPQDYQRFLLNTNVLNFGKQERFDYFAQTVSTRYLQNKIFNKYCNPVDRLTEYFNIYCDTKLQTAVSSCYGYYLSANFYNLNQNQFYIPALKYNISGWSINNYKNQLHGLLKFDSTKYQFASVYSSQNLYSHNKKIIDLESLYDTEVNIDFVSLNTGDLILINCQNHHELRVDNIEDYLILSFFINKTFENQLVIWI